MTSTFKPCPWCGNVPRMHIEPLWHGSHGYPGCYEYIVRCPRCGATVPHGGYDTIYHPVDWAEEQAIKAWNRRAE